MVEAHEDDKRHRYDTKRLTEKFDKLGAPYDRTPGLGIDIMWTVDGRAVMLDLKTPNDIIASAEDGRLHSQMRFMETHDCLLYGFLIEGTASHDGITVGYGTHAWDLARYYNLLLSLQCEGAKITHSPSPNRTASRLLSLYRWTGKEEHTSWRAPIKPSYSLKPGYEPAHRARVEFLMGLPMCGEERAVALLGAFKLSDIVSGQADLTQVPGVGKGLAGLWKGFLDGV